MIVFLFKILLVFNTYSSSNLYGYFEDKNDTVTIIFEVGFAFDRTVLYYNNEIIFDKFITTNDLSNSAASFSFKKNKNTELIIEVNKHHRIFIDLKNTNIVFVSMDWQKNFIIQKNLK